MIKPCFWEGKISHLHKLRRALHKNITHWLWKKIRIHAHGKQVKAMFSLLMLMENPCFARRKIKRGEKIESMMLWEIDRITPSSRSRWPCCTSRGQWEQCRCLLVPAVSQPKLFYRTAPSGMCVCEYFGSTPDAFSASPSARKVLLSSCKITRPKKWAGTRNLLPERPMWGAELRSGALGYCLSN